MGVDLLPPAQVTPRGQTPLESRVISSLAASLMGQQPAISGGSGQIPLASLAQMMQSNPKALQGLWDGFDNWMNGYQWNGMPTQSTLNGLSNQAANYTAGGAAGL